MSLCCRHCPTVLVVGVTWQPSRASRGILVCRECVNAANRRWKRGNPVAVKKQKGRAEERRLARDPVALRLRVERLRAQADRLEALLGPRLSSRAG